MENENIRDAFLVGLKSTRKEHAPLCIQMLGWQNATEDPKDKIIKDAGKKALADTMREEMHVKRLGGVFEQFRREMDNRCLVRSRECTVDVADAHRKMENCRIMHAMKKRTGEG